MVTLVSFINLWDPLKFFASDGVTLCRVLASDIMTLNMDIYRVRQ